MLKRERQVYILHQVNLRNKVLSADLSLAWALPPSMSATFISGSILAIFEYANHPNINVIVIGDKISRNSNITIDPEAVVRIRQLKANVCFLGINALNLANGVSDSDWDAVQIKKPWWNLHKDTPLPKRSTPNNPCRFARVQKSIPSSQNFHRMIPC